MYKLPDIPCRKCGGDTSIYYIVRMERKCLRCGFSEFIKDLEEKENEQNAYNSIRI